jgi:polyisoprenoid-binding protein YceI
MQGKPFSGGIPMTSLFKSKLVQLGFAALLLAPFTAAQAADTYTFDPMHTSILWHANHFGFSNPSGKFTAISGSVTLDEANPANSKVKVDISTDGMFTGLPVFDAHIKSEKFLDVAAYPAASFVSDKVEITGKNTAKVHGQLTLHGVTRPEVLDVTLNKLEASPMNQKKTAGFTASTTIKRSDFGISAYIPGVSDEVKIDIEAEAGLSS